MKNILVLLGICSSLLIYGQTGSPLAKNGRLDFAVPEHPAFNILKSNTDNILRPGNSQELLSLIYSDFLSGTTPIIPKDFSVEFSPAQLIGINSITLEDYNKNGKRILYDSKVSIGGKTSEDGSNLMAFATGLRLTWVDHTSLATNRDFIDEACKGLVSEAKATTTFINQLINEGYKLNGTVLSDELVASDDNVKNSLDSLYKVYFADSSFFSADMKAMRDKYKNAVWNKIKFESAMAIKFNSPDSLFVNSYYSMFQLYNTVALPVGNSGQWLIGLNYANTRKDSIESKSMDSLAITYDTVRYKYSLLTLSTRLYAGTNKLKAFIEGSGKYENSDKLWLGITIGAEINITDGIWAMINAGNTWTKSTGKTASGDAWTDEWYWGFDFRFKIPEKMKL